MTPEAQQSAIAKACGWTLVADGVWRSPDNSHHDRLPDYLHDLNAMHEAEKTLGSKERALFARALRCLLGFYSHDYFDLLHATAAQRAEAFLRTSGRWSDEEEETPP